MSLVSSRRARTAPRPSAGAMHRAAHGAVRRALRGRRSLYARGVALALLAPGLLMLTATPSDAAIVKPFTAAFSANTTGQIILRGNTNETCDGAPLNNTTITCAQTQAGADGYNNNFVMKYVDVDSDASTFNSSSATVDVPTGSQVLYARLSWSGARTGATGSNGAKDATKSNQVRLQGPGATDYTTVTADPTDVNVGDTSYDAYGASADVTSYVAAQGAGVFTVANIQAGLGADRYAGWSMAVAYSNPSEPVRNLTIFSGWGTVRNGQTLDIPVSGFQTPPNGTVDTRVGVAAFEGDRGLTGDQLSLGDGTGTGTAFTQLNNAVNPASNSFNSTVSQTGVTVGGRTPNYDNTIGEDVDRFNATGLLKNNQTTATLRLSTSSDVYYPQVVTFATQLYAPRLTQTKTGTDVNGGTLEPGDRIRYDIDTTNDGLDDAAKSQLTDAIPSNTSYVRGSLSVDGTGVTDAADGDTGAFVDDANQGQVRVNLGTDATGTAGGAMAVKADTRVSFLVTVDTDLFADTAIINTSSASYTGAQTGLGLSTTSNTATTAVTASRADVRVRTTADQPVVQRGDTASYTVEVVNRGPKPAEGVTLADTLPQGASVASITTDQGTCRASDASCDLGTLPVGTTVTVHVTLKLAAGSPDPSSLGSTVSASTIDPDPANNTSSAGVGVNSPPKATDTQATTGADGTATVEVLKNASDPDGDTLGVVKAVVQPPAHGTVVVNADGTLTYTADAGYVGSDSVVYTVSDGRGGSVTATLGVTVPNTPPVAEDDDSAAAPTGQTAIDVLGNDTDVNGDTLAVASVTQPTGGKVVIGADGTVGFTPNAGFKGTTTFTYTVRDGRSGAATATVTVTVPNTAPLASDDEVSTDYLTSTLIDVLADDADDNGDPLSIVRGSITTPTSGGKPAGTAAIENGQVRYTPPAGFSGVASFAYTITDGTSTSTATVRVSVGNAAPTAGDGTATSDGTKTEIDVLQHAADPNGDPLSVTGITGVAHGSVVLNADGTVTYYTPTKGYKGADSFDYTVSDGHGGTATGTIDITVQNQPPTATNVRRTAPAGTPITVPVLNGATDPNGDTLTLSDVSAPAHGKLTFDKTAGTITYTPDQAFLGDEVLTFTVSDGDGGTTTATLTVRSVNAAPVVQGDSTTVAATKGGSATIDVLANDSDPNGDPLTICGLTTPAGGSATVVDNKLVYTYDDDFASTDVFSYTACDGRGGETTGRVVVTVVDTAPTALPDTAATTRNSARSVDVLANDSDVDGDDVTLVSADDPVGSTGTVVGTATVLDGQVVFTPAPGFTGTATFGYHIRDARGGIAASTATVTVGNTAPVAKDISTGTAYDTTVSVSPDVSDADGDDLTVAVASRPQDAKGTTVGSVSLVKGQLVYDPPAGFSGPVTFTYTVSDGIDSATATVTVTVDDGAPSITGGTAQSIGARIKPAPITTTDPNGDTVTVTVVKGSVPTGLTLNGDGTWTGTATKPGSYSFTVEACDDRTPKACVQQDVTIVVGDTAPVAGDLDTTTPYDTTTKIDVFAPTADHPQGTAYDPDDGDTLTVSALGQPKDASGNVVGTATIVDGRAVYDPPAGFSGPVSFTYTVTDGTQTATGTLTVTVADGLPSITAGTDQEIAKLATPEPLTLSDPNGDPVTVSVVDGRVPPGLTLDADGTWSGRATDSGSYVATVQVCDDRTPKGCTTQTVTIAVDDAAPVAVNDTRTTPGGKTIVVPVLANDSDKDGDPLTITKVTTPVDADGKPTGTATIVGGTISYVPPKGFRGPVTLTYTLSDGTEESTATVTITVANAAPEIVSGTDQVVRTGAAPARLGTQDPNGDPTTVTIVGGHLPPGLTLDADGSWSGTATTSGTYTSSVRVCDDQTPAACTTHQVVLRVPEAFTNGGGSGAAGSPYAGGSGGSSTSGGGILPSTGAPALLPWAGLAGIVLVGIGGGLVLRRRSEREGEQAGPRVRGGARRGTPRRASLRLSAGLSAGSSTGSSTGSERGFVVLLVGRRGPIRSTVPTRRRGATW